MPRPFVTVLLMLFLVGCRQGIQNPAELQVDLRLEPRGVGPAVATLTLQEGGAPVQGAKVEMVANMNHAGMVPVKAPFREVAPGRYQADFRWTMAGDWYVDVTGHLGDGTPFERTVDVPGITP